LSLLLSLWWSSTSGVRDVLRPLQRRRFSGADIVTDQRQILRVIFVSILLICTAERRSEGRPELATHSAVNEEVDWIAE